LGQHFLKNKNKIRKIVEALELKIGDIVVEIGPGHGELTDQLKIKKSKIKIIAIEKDKILAKDLKEKFKDNNIEIIEGDALKILTDLTYNFKLTTNNYKLTGNIPYYITGRLLRTLSELKNKPFLIILTIQKEVAQRICGMRIARFRPAGFSNANAHIRIKQKSGGMNLLAAIVQFWAEPKIIGYISKNDFRPAPKVDGAIIQLTTYNQQPTTEEADKYYKFVRVLFKQPRKTIINNLRPTTDNLQLLAEKLKSIGANKDDRPQNLTLEQIRQLSTLF